MLLSPDLVMCLYVTLIVAHLAAVVAVDLLIDTSTDASLSPSATNGQHSRYRLDELFDDYDEATEQFKDLSDVEEIITTRSQRRTIKSKEEKSTEVGKEGKVIANSTARTRENLKKCVERSEKDLARLFPDSIQYEKVRQEFLRYHRQARKYGMDRVKARILGLDISDVAREHEITLEERVERKKQETQRYVVRRRLKKYPNDEKMLTRAKELGMDMNDPIRKRRPADFVKRFLEIYYPDMIRFHLEMAIDADLAIKKHPLGFYYLVKKRSKMEVSS